MGDVAGVQTRVLGGGESGFVTTRFDALLGWARKFSLFQYPFITACCAMEFMAVQAPRYDLGRFGAEAPRFSPRQSDVLWVVGTVSQRQAPVLKRIYEQMTEPKWVIAFGTCASCGGFYDNYATLAGIDKVVPVDVYIPGCPPRPEAVLDGLMLLQAKIGRGDRTPATLKNTQLPEGAAAGLHPMAKIILERLREKFGDDVLETRSFRGDETALVRAERWREVAEFVRTDARCGCDYFVDLSCVDCVDEGDPARRFEVYVIAYSVAKKHRVRLKARLPEDAPEIDSLVPVWAGADWLERECWDLFGVRFRGHPDLRRILMYEEFQGHPLRKDYPAGRTQPLVPYREGTFDELGPFLEDEGMPLDRGGAVEPEPR